MAPLPRHPLNRLRPSLASGRPWLSASRPESSSALLPARCSLRAVSITPVCASSTTPFGVSSTTPAWASSTRPSGLHPHRPYGLHLPRSYGSHYISLYSCTTRPRPPLLASRATLLVYDLRAFPPRCPPARSSPTSFAPRSSPLCGRSPLSAGLVPPRLPRSTLGPPRRYALGPSRLSAFHRLLSSRSGPSVPRNLRQLASPRPVASSSDAFTVPAARDQDCSPS